MVVFSALLASVLLFSAEAAGRNQKKMRRRRRRGRGGRKVDLGGGHFVDTSFTTTVELTGTDGEPASVNQMKDYCETATAALTTPEGYQSSISCVPVDDGIVEISSSLTPTGFTGGSRRRRLEGSAEGTARRLQGFLDMPTILDPLVTEPVGNMNECELVNNISMVKCKQGVNWDCDFINAQIKVTGGCRAEVNMMGQLTMCGDGGGKDEEYICPVPTAGMPGAFSNKEKKEIALEMTDSLANSALALSLEAEVDRVVVNESIETYCGFPSTKIKLRAQDIIGRYKDTPTACNCQELCMGIGADAWMFNLEKGLCQCRSVTEEKNRATFNTNYISSFDPARNL